MNAPLLAETPNAAELVADKALIDIDARLALLQRASARCTLFELNELPLDDAFEELIEPFMAIVAPPLCPTCGGQAPCHSTFCTLCAAADKKQKPADERTKPLRNLLDDKVLLDAAWRALNDPRRRPTPEATVEAVKYAVRERGASALDEPSIRSWLRECDAKALAELDRWLVARGVK